METEKKLAVLQHVYTAVLADAVRMLGLTDDLPRIEAMKRQEQLAVGQRKCQAFGIQTADRVFSVLSELFNCADWQVEATDDGIIATAGHCQLCGMARKLGAPSPCRLYCLDPMEGMIRGLDKDAKFETQETLWDGDCCRVRVKTTATSEFPLL